MQRFCKIHFQNLLASLPSGLQPLIKEKFYRKFIYLFNFGLLIVDRGSVVHYEQSENAV